MRPDVGKIFSVLSLYTIQQSDGVCPHSQTNIWSCVTLVQNSTWVIVSCLRAYKGCCFCFERLCLKSSVTSLSGTFPSERCAMRPLFQVKRVLLFLENMINQWKNLSWEKKVDLLYKRVFDLKNAISCFKWSFHQDNSSSNLSFFFNFFNWNNILL